MSEAESDGRGFALRVVNNCLVGRVRQISRILTAHFDEELRSVGITANQLTILSTIAVLEQATPTELQPYLQMELSTLSRNLKRMVVQEWLATIPGEDRRSHSLIVAPRGFRVLEDAAAGWERAHQWAQQRLGDGNELRRLAKRLNPLLPG